MEKIEIKIINSSDNQLPKLETLGAAGADLRAFTSEPITLKPLERALISTGLKILSKNTFLQTKKKKNHFQLVGIKILL